MKFSFLITFSIVLSANGFGSFTKPKAGAGTRAVVTKPAKGSAKVPPKSVATKPKAAKKNDLFSALPKFPAAAPKPKAAAAKPKAAAGKPKAAAAASKPKAAKKNDLFSGLPKFGAKTPAAAAKPKVAAKKPALKKTKISPKAKASAPAPAPISRSRKQPLPRTIDVLDLPGVLPPVGFFDPLNFAARANDNLLLKYREAELTHGRVAMVAFLGFLFGELAAGNNGILKQEVNGYAIGQIEQVPGWFWVSFLVAAFAVETTRNQKVLVDPTAYARSSPEFGTYNLDALPGDIGFDPLGLKPSDPEELKIMQTKELQHGRVAMIASSGFLAQELTNQKGIVENIVSFVTDVLQ